VCKAEADIFVVKCFCGFCCLGCLLVVRLVLLPLVVVVVTVPDVVAASVVGFVAFVVVAAAVVAAVECSLAAYVAGKAVIDDAVVVHGMRASPRHPSAIPVARLVATCFASYF